MLILIGRKKRRRGNYFLWPSTVLHRLPLNTYSRESLVGGGAVRKYSRGGELLFNNPRPTKAINSAETPTAFRRYELRERRIARRNDPLPVESLENRSETDILTSLRCCAKINLAQVRPKAPRVPRRERERERERLFQPWRDLHEMFYMKQPNNESAADISAAFTRTKRRLDYVTLRNALASLSLSFAFFLLTKNCDR